MKQFLYILIVFLLVSCTSNTIYKKPKDLIPKDTMVGLLTDLFVASSSKYVKNKFLEKKVNYLPLVYEKFRVDSIRFSSSNLYYTSKMEEYHEILLEVKNRTTILLTKYEKEIRIRDSLIGNEKEEFEGKEFKEEEVSRKVEKETSKKSKLYLK